MAINPGTNLNSVPSARKQTLDSNYLDLASASNAGWSQQYVPDLMEKEAEVFGPRTISGFLSQVGAEESMTADQVIWSEQGRLHLSFTGKMATATTFVVQKDIDGNTVASGDHGVRVNDTIILADANAVTKCLVVSISGSTLTIATYDNSTITALNTDNTTTCLVYGSEFGKGKTYGNATAGAAYD